MIHRVIPWLNREVNVLLDHCRSHAMYVIDRILNMLPQHSIRSRDFKDLVQPYFGNQTDHFIHEFYTFARSVYDMSGFDENAVYSNNPNYTTEVQEISSTSSDDDSDIEVIQTVKNGESGSKKKSPSALASGQGFKKILLKRAGGGSSSAEGSTSVEPVAGPSGLNIQVQETIEVCESDPDDVEVLDYVKPEPELVTLSSGEEEEPKPEPQPDQRQENSNVSDCQVLKLADVSFDTTEESSSTEENSSGESYRPGNQTRKNKYKSAKGKCKSDGSGLKGKQKRKYVRKSKEEKRSRSSDSEKSRHRRRHRRDSSSSESHMSSSRSSSREDTSSSDYEPIAKYLTKKKDVKTHKKSKKVKKDRRKSKKESRIRVKSCVVVPNKRRSYVSASESDDSSRPLESYWSQVKTMGKLTKIRLKRKRSNSSSSENSIRRVKYSSKIVSDSSNSPSTNSVENSRTDISSSDNQSGARLESDRFGSSSSEINVRINLSSGSSSD